MSTPVWQRKAGKNPKGGLNEAGRRSAKKQGMNLKRPVKSGDNPRRASFLARMGNMPGPERDSEGRPTRLLKSLQVWGADSKAEAEAMRDAIAAGTYHPFTGPINKQDGSAWLAEGEIANDGDLAGMFFFVEGIEGDIPS